MISFIPAGLSGELMMMDRRRLFDKGIERITQWLELNNVRPVRVLQEAGKPTFGVCAYYRSDCIYIWINACATIGTAGRQWSYPGYCVDRTPYGVLAHEVGHHVDLAHGSAGGTYGKEWRWRTKELPLTGYSPNDNEWFAEMFRLFVTNPDLLRLVRPKTFALMAEQWKSVETRAWDEVLKDAPRQMAAARNKFAKVHAVHGQVARQGLLR